MRMKFRINWPKMIMALCQIVIAVLLLVNPERFTTMIIIAGGILLAVIGILAIVDYLRDNPVQAATKQNLAKGLLALIVGCFAILRSSAVSALFPALAILYGLMMLMTALMRIQWAVDFFRMHRPNWWVMGIGALVTLLFSIVILLNPFPAVNIMWGFVAITLLMSAASDIWFIVTEFMQKDEHPHGPHHHHEPRPQQMPVSAPAPEARPDATREMPNRPMMPPPEVAPETPRPTLDAPEIKQ